MLIKSIFAFLLVVITTLPSVWYHGRMTNRWSDNEIADFHSTRIHSVPLKVGEWRVVDEGTPLPDYAITELGVHSHFNRIYENDTGDRVSALVMVGDAGPLSRHPVEICYGNRAKRLVHSFDYTVERESVPQEFTICRYEPKSVLEDKFFVAYSYCYDDEWKTPTAPRYEYGGKPVLYKMQVLTNAGETPDRVAPTYLLDFIEKFSAVVWRERPQQERSTTDNG
ncbi:hypothetical protein ACFL2H_08335 [Planctomycetota bacterium]